VDRKKSWECHATGAEDFSSAPVACYVVEDIQHFAVLLIPKDVYFDDTGILSAVTVGQIDFEIPSGSSYCGLYCQQVARCKCFFRYFCPRSSVGDVIDCQNNYDFCGQQYSKK
jgi:hypothetical protein